MRKFSQLILTIFALTLIFTINAISDDGTSGVTTKPKEIPKLPKYLKEDNKQYFNLPPVPENRTPLSQGKKLFQLKAVIFEGNTVFSNQELNKVAEKFINHDVGMAELEELRYQLTRYYTDRGYINSGALIKPNQKVTNGVLTYLIIEGKLTNIDIKGNGSLRENYIKKRLWRDSDEPFNTLKLKEYFQMLIQDPLIDKMDGNIVPGIKQGEATLELDVTRENPYQFSMTTNNTTSPNLGSETLKLNQTVRNLTGVGDSFNTLFEITEGKREIDATYSIPLNANNTTLSFNYNYSDNEIVSELKAIDVESTFQSSELSLNHPIFHNIERDFSVGVGLKTQKSNNYIINNNPFDFSPGAVEGESKSTILQLIQSFNHSNLKHAFALHSSFNFGVDIFSPTIHSDSMPDGEFFSWIGQFNYGTQLKDNFGQLIFKGNLQLSNEPLLSIDKYVSGGFYNVRGYRENENIGDNGYMLSIEWRIPVWESQKTGDYDKTKMLQIAPFMDYGSTWDKHYLDKTQIRNEGEPDETTIYREFKSRSENTLHSIGIGLLWSTPKIDAQIYYGYAIEDVEPSSEYNLQDDGIHFNVTYNFL
ncbi:MAG: ShlB/FhaC/HecB family hemolysin secretion/activation protein [Desulfamplus sp.]|nr:ShlB/FhaC/HecB family hemolysin secretion/activation protein [Desulfamplus sp.]